MQCFLITPLVFFLIDCIATFHMLDHVPRSVVSLLHQLLFPGFNISLLVLLFSTYFKGTLRLCCLDFVLHLKFQALEGEIRTKY